MKDVPKQVDASVAKFTKDILEIARKNGVDFGYTGHLKSQKAEIEKTMKINNGVVRDLLKK